MTILRLRTLNLLNTISPTYQNITMELYVIPYTILCYCVFNWIRFVSYGDSTIASYVVSWLVNLCYIGTMTYGTIHKVSQPIFVFYAQHIMSLLIGYYTFDTVRLLHTKDKYIMVYVFHHVFSLLLILLHAWEVLPISVGSIFLYLFELSNVILIPYQLCLEKDWKKFRYSCTHAMVLSYVPIRLIAIPIYSARYLPYMQYMTTWAWATCASGIGFLVLFSMYYAIAIGYKYSLWLTKSNDK